jgi:transcriptional regulator with XRE-family HTH domain
VSTRERRPPEALTHAPVWRHNSRAQAQIALLQEELRIKDARMAQIPSHRRPHYPPTERMAILELRAARGWNQVQTAKAMLVTPETVAAWNRRVDEQGPHAFVQLSEPVNRFPDFVRYIVRRLKALCPSMGKVGIARILARAGLHPAATTVGQILKGDQPCPDQATTASEDMQSIEAAATRVVTATQPRLARGPDGRIPRNHLRCGSHWWNISKPLVTWTNYDTPSET